MTPLVHNPARNCINSLGIPVDDLDLAEAVERVVAMAKTRDDRARLVSTLNVDFLVNSLGTSAKRDRHPELLHILRDSDMVTADGFPILWLSRIAGKPLTQRVCGSDLVPALASRAAEEGLSVFLLGGGEGVARDAAQCLIASYPTLQIAGTAAPYIHVDGPSLAECNAHDTALLEQINRSGADILLLGLGNPKQELWFNRNRDRLNVPVSIGVGGTFEFITGNMRRAPQWMQNANLEWVYRITQDPARLFQRYVKGLFKLCWLSLPLINSRIGEAIAFRGRQSQPEESLRFNTLWCSREQSLDVLRLPPLVSARQLKTLAQWLTLNPSPTALRIIDFSQVRRVQMAGYQSLFTLAELQRRGDSPLQLLGMPAKLRRQLEAARVMDVMADSEGNALDSLTRDSQGASNASGCSSFTLPAATLVFLRGRLNRDSLKQLGLIESLIAGARDRRYILDLRHVTLLESSAIVEMQPLWRTDKQPQVVVSGASANSRQMFTMADLGDTPNFIDDNELLQHLWGAADHVA